MISLVVSLEQNPQIHSQHFGSLPPEHQQVVLGIDVWTPADINSGVTKPKVLEAVEVLNKFYLASWPVAQSGLVDTLENMPAKGSLTTNQKKKTRSTYPLYGGFLVT